jgi:peptidoglycan-associated lipoprotein
VRLDRDVIPTFVPTDAGFGGVSHEWPYLRRGWSKTLGGPVIVGAKWNLISQSRDDPMALAVRVMAKFPSGSTWASTNDWDGHVDVIASREFREQIELTGTAGAVIRGDPDEFRVSDSAKWGLGATFPSRSPFRALVEWEGEFVIKDNVLLIAPPYIAEDGSIAPLLSRIHDPANVKLGGVWQASRGWFVHAGLNYSTGTGDHIVGGREVNHNALGFDVRVGFSPGVKRFVPPPPPAPPPPPPTPPAPPPPPPANQNPIVGPIKCDPCVVEPGRSTTLSVDATDPDKDPLTYRWSAPTGTFGTPNAPKTTWTAPDQEGSVPITVTVEDGRGGRGTSTLTMQVVRPVVKTVTFEDVHFDFDRYNLRPEAVKILDDAIDTLRANPDMRITIEGHTCNIGTAEYNLALGERRAQAVRDYLINRGVATGRMQTVSYGEERPKHDNSREETRRLNRRAALTVRLQ